MQSRILSGTSMKLAFLLALPWLATAPDLGAAKGLPEPTWDRELALQTAAMGADDARLRHWFSLAREGERARLDASLRSFAEASAIAAPAREWQLFRFVQGLADFPPERVPGEMLDYLEARPVQTWVSHEESAGSAVPLFNIPSAVAGLRNGLRSRLAEERALQLLAGISGRGADGAASQWIDAYLAGSAAERRGFLNALEGATRAQDERLGQTARQRAEDHPGESAALTAVAGRTAVAAQDLEALQQVVQTGSGPELALALRQGLARLDLTDLALLLLFSMERAPVENAALAIALLAPRLQDNAEVTASLFDLLEDPALGTSAALALARYSDPAVQQGLEEFAAGTRVAQAEPARMVQWVEDAPADDNSRIALGYPVPEPVDTPLPFDGFRSYAGLHARHQDLAATTPWVHPAVIGATRNGRNIWAYRLGDEDLLTRKGLPEHAMLTNGGIHAREWQSPETVTGVMELLEEHQGDGYLFSYLRDNANVIVIPVLNVDGFLQTQRYPDGSWMGTDPDSPETSPRDGRMRRKNMLNVDEILATQDDHLLGVDLNRNNPPYWNTSPNHSSGATGSLVHHGAAARSEPETLALDNAAQLGPIGQLSLYTDVHSFSRALLWVRNNNSRLTQQTENLLRTFSQYHAAFPAGKVYRFNTGNNVALNQGIGSTDEYFTHTYQVPSWTLEIEPGDNAGTEYGGLGRNGHDGFILPDSEIRRVRTELARTFAIAYYRQSGPPAVTEFRLIDTATGATVVDAAWDTVGTKERSLHVYQAQAVQLGREYLAWIAFDKPMRWQTAGNVSALPGQAGASLDVGLEVFTGNAALTSAKGNAQWLVEPGGAPSGYAGYMTDALAIAIQHPADTNNQSLVDGAEQARLKLQAEDMTKLKTDANPATVARWANGGWSGYENTAGADLTDTGGTDSTITYTITTDALGDPFVIEAGTTGSWYDPDRDGEGFVLEILADSRAVMYWFTYDDHGKQAWYIATGNIHGNRIEFPELLQFSGGKFGPGFDPDEVIQTVAGSASFIWSGCNSGEMEWELNAEGEYRHGRMHLQRLSRLMGIDCGKVALPPPQAAALHSGAWFDPAHSGEGYTFEFLADSRALVYWFSFDAEGNPRWFIGTGALKSGIYEFDEMLTTRGGKFGAAFDPAEVEILPWGSLTLDLECETGAATFAPTEPGFPAGSLNLKRLTVLPGLDCRDTIGD